MFKFDFKGLSEENVNVFLDMIPYVSPKIIGVTKNEHDVIVNCEEQYNENILEELIRLKKKIAFKILNMYFCQ